MGRGLRVAAVKTNSAPFAEVSAAESPAVESRSGRSTTQRGCTSSQEADSTLQDGIHPEEVFLTDERRSSHVQAGPSPQCNSAHGWLLEVDCKKITDPEEGPFWYAEGIEIAFCTIPGGDAKHVIGKDGCTLQRLQALLGTLIGVVDQPSGNSLVQIYGRREGQNIVRHFLSCLQEGFYGVLGALERVFSVSG